MSALGEGMPLYRHEHPTVTNTMDSQREGDSDFNFTAYQGTGESKEVQESRKLSVLSPSIKLLNSSKPKENRILMSELNLISGSRSMYFCVENTDLTISDVLDESTTTTDGQDSRLIGEPQEPNALVRSLESVYARRFCRISPELRTVISVAFVIHLELIAYTPVETLQSSLNSEAGLGTLSLACLYGPYFIFAIAAPYIVRTLTPKWTIFMGWACDLFYIGANFYPTWLTLVPTAALTGAITGPLWTAKDLYISQMARQTTIKKTNKNCEFDKVYQSTLSFYNGIVFASISFSQVIGQLISSIVLTQSQGTTVEELNCGAFHCSSNLKTVFLNITNGTSETIINKPEKSLVYVLMGILISLVMLAMLVTAFGIRQIPFSHSETSVKSTITSCAVRFTDIKILLMIPQIALFGFSHGVILSDYTRSYVTCGKGVGILGYVMISEGIFAMAASLACGRLVKYTGRRLQAVLALCGYVALYASMWFWKPTSDVNVALYFVIPVLFGVTDVVFQTHICTVLAVMFKHDLPAAFANYYTFRAISKALSFGLSGFVCVWVKLTVATVLIALAIISFTILELLLICVKVEKSKDELVVETKLVNTNKDVSPE